jgi:hypothetical protein
MNARIMLLAAVTMVGTPALATAPVSPPVPSPFTRASDSPVARLGPGESTLTAILDLIHQVNPSVPAPRAARLASLIVEECQARGIQPLILAGIIAQESHFHASVQRCQYGFCDYGLGQVNWETWHRALQLDRRRLRDDDAYNIAMAAEILADTRARFGEGPGWWTRYHDHRPGRRVLYGQMVRAHAPVLLGRI